jgi:trehalose 6-phosphate phosphatase
MPNILSRQQLPTLANFAASNVLIAFDYDGTLSAIAATPQQARMRPRTSRLLRTVAERYPCVVISGRKQADIARHVENIPLWHVAGNHGAEPWGENEAYASRVRDWIAPLRRRLAGCQGIVLEDKTYSLTIHYRHARSKKDALAAITAAVRPLKGARIVGGNQAVNIVPRGSPHKGIALESIRRLLACDTVIYVGDDETDEDAFRAGRPDRLLSIRVGAKRGTRARHWVKSQAEVDTLLQLLLALRPLRHDRRTRRAPVRTQAGRPSPRRPEAGR